LKPVLSHKPDIARVIMKEQNKDCIKYLPIKEARTNDPLEHIPYQRRIPKDKLSEQLS
jgi:hypothetical protein